MGLLLIQMDVHLYQMAIFILNTLEIIQFGEQLSLIRTPFLILEIIYSKSLRWIKIMVVTKSLANLMRMKMGMIAIQRQPIMHNSLMIE